MFGPLAFLANIGRCPNFLDQALIILHIQPHRDLLYYNKYGLQSPVQFLKGSLSTKNKNQYCFYHPKLCLPTFLTFLTKILTLHCLQFLPKCSSSQHHSLSQLHKRKNEPNEQNQEHQHQYNKQPLEEFYRKMFLKICKIHMKKPVLGPLF